MERGFLEAGRVEARGVEAGGVEAGRVKRGCTQRELMNSCGAKPMRWWNRAARVLLLVVTSIGVSAVSRGSHASTSTATESDRTRERQLEALASEAALALCAAHWSQCGEVESGACSPVVSLDGGVLAEWGDGTPRVGGGGEFTGQTDESVQPWAQIDARDALASLTTPIRARPRAVWSALRAGGATRVERDGVGSATRGAIASREKLASRGGFASQVGLASLTDDELDQACQLLVREALLRVIDESTSVPPDILAEILEALPRPLKRRGSNASELRVWDQLERAGRLGASANQRANALCADLLEAQRVQREWVGRLDVCYAMLMHRASGAEGAALVRVSRALRLAHAGWDPEEIAAIGDAADEPLAPSTLTQARASPRKRPTDQVSAEVRLARSQGAPCFALGELLARAESTAVRTIQSALVDGDRRLRLACRTVGISPETLDRWRADCGLTRTTRGWSAPHSRPKPAPPRLRDAPFGVKPL